MPLATRALRFDGKEAEAAVVGEPSGLVVEFGAKGGDDFGEGGGREVFEVVILELLKPVFHAGFAF